MKSRTDASGVAADKRQKTREKPITETERERLLRELEGRLPLHPLPREFTAEEQYKIDTLFNSFLYPLFLTLFGIAKGWYVKGKLNFSELKFLFSTDDITGYW